MPRWQTVTDLPPGPYTNVRVENYVDTSNGRQINGIHFNDGNKVESRLNASGLPKPVGDPTHFLIIEQLKLEAVEVCFLVQRTTLPIFPGLPPFIDQILEKPAPCDTIDRRVDNLNDLTRGGSVKYIAVHEMVNK
jgi:hypothetical protein